MDQTCSHYTDYDYEATAESHARSPEQAIAVLREEAARELEEVADVLEPGEAYAGYYEALALARATSFADLSPSEDESGVWLTRVGGETLARVQLSERSSGWVVEHDAVRLPMEVCILLEAEPETQ